MQFQNSKLLTVLGIKAHSLSSNLSHFYKKKLSNKLIFFWVNSDLINLKKQSKRLALVKTHVVLKSITNAFFFLTLNSLKISINDTYFKGFKDYFNNPDLVIFFSIKGYSKALRFGKKQQTHYLVFNTTGFSNTAHSYLKCFVFFISITLNTLRQIFKNLLYSSFLLKKIITYYDII